MQETLISIAGMQETLVTSAGTQGTPIAIARMREALISIAKMQETLITFTGTQKIHHHPWNTGGTSQTLSVTPSADGWRI